MSITVETINRFKATVHQRQTAKAKAEGSLSAALDTMFTVTGTRDIEEAKQKLIELEDKEVELQNILTEKLQQLDAKYGDLL